MKKPCRGAEDKTDPKEIAWKSFPHRLFFGRERSGTWGDGGVAFVDPVVDTREKTRMCLYKITYDCENLFFGRYSICFRCKKIFMEFRSVIFFFSRAQTRAVQRCVASRKRSECFHKLSFVRSDRSKLDHERKVQFQGGQHRGISCLLQKYIFFFFSNNYEPLSKDRVFDIRAEVLVPERCFLGKAVRCPDTHNDVRMF